MPGLEIRLVSDDPTLRQIFADEIEEAGHLVASVGSLQVGRLSEADSAPVDLVLVDQALLGKLQDVDFKRIGSTWPRAHIALLADGDTDRMHFSDQFAVIARETRLSELLRAIEAAARGDDLDLPANAATSRMDLFVQKIATRPAVAGVERELQSVYDAPPAELPDAFASVLGKLPPSPA